MSYEVSTSHWNSGISYFELFAPGFGKLDEEYAALACQSVTQGHYGEAGALLKQIKDSDLKNKLFQKLAEQIAELPSGQAYDATKSFVLNYCSDHVFEEQMKNAALKNDWEEVKHCMQNISVEERSRAVDAFIKNVDEFLLSASKENAPVFENLQKKFREVAQSLSIQTNPQSLGMLPNKV